MDLVQLATFQAVVDTGSFEAAARQLHVTPSAVSQRIRALESTVGQVLVRRAKPCVATPAGEALIRFAGQVELLEREALAQARDAYWAEQVEIQRRGAAAWLARAEGRNDEALATMRAAAELEEATEKHNITPGPIATARELLGDLLLELGKPAEAAREYEASLGRAPNRFKALHGVARASELAGDRDRARAFYTRLVAVAAASDNQRPELAQARAFLGRP